MFVYLPLRDLIVMYRFLFLYMFTQINKLIAEDSYCSYRFSVHFLLDCLRYSASCTKSGNFWTLRLGNLENKHSTAGLSISFQLCRKLTKHLLYHIANFDGGTQCEIWGVICIFMKSTSCSSGCGPSPWTWPVLHITGVFSVPSLYTIHHSLRDLYCLGNVRYCIPRCFHSNDLPSLALGVFPWRSQTDQSQKFDLRGGQSCVGFNSIVQRLYGQFHSFLPDMLPGMYTSYWQFFKEATQCLTLWKISLDKFCKNFISGV